jgi:hypothetical protein
MPELTDLLLLLRMTVERLTNNCTIRDRLLLINRIGWNVGINRQGYAQVLWKNWL